MSASKRGAALVQIAAIDMDSRMSLDKQADDDERPDERPASAPTTRPRRLRSGADIVDAIIDEGKKPIVKLGVPEVDALAPVKTGHLVGVVGRPGAGKSTWLAQILYRHALDVGPAIFVSLELTDGELGARIVGQRTGMSWVDAARARRADIERVLAHPRLFIMADDDGSEGISTTEIEQAIGYVRETYPDQPIMVAVDYVQLWADSMEGRDERERVKTAVNVLKRIARRNGKDTVVFMVSQPSRAAGEGLRDGTRIGAGAMGTGAESAQIERACYVFLALGGDGAPVDGSPDETWCDLSIGKGRMGGGDHVVRMAYNGRCGTFRVVGDAMRASEYTDQRKASKDDTKLERLRSAAVGCLTSADAPMYTRDLAVKAGIRKDDVAAVIKGILADSKVDVVRVAHGKKSGGHWPLWTRRQAVTAGYQVAEDGGAS